VLKLPLYAESSNYLVQYIPNWLKCLCIKKVTGKTFEVQIFCANVRKGNVKRAPSSPIIGPCANPKVSIWLGNLYQALAHLLQFKKNQAELCKIIIWADTKNSSRSGSIGTSFGIWVARIIFWQPVHLSVKVVDPLSLVYTEVSYKLIFSRSFT